MISKSFTFAVNQIKKLQDHDRYLGAFIFGSFARGDHDKNSDLDVIVVVNEDNDCKEINHPVINNIKLDITFRSFSQIESDNDEVVKKNERKPMLGESIILFDKTKKLQKLKDKYSKIKRKKANQKDFQFIQFMIYHADNKAKRNLKDDKETALLAMGININEIIKFHYHINGKWWVSNKRLLPDLRNWDPELAKLIQDFAKTSNVFKKYKIWTEILEYVTKPLGGRKQISEINCNCNICIHDLRIIL